MSNVNEVNIKINKAIITSIEITLKDGVAQWDVSGSLISTTGKEVSRFAYSSQHWEDDKKIEVPVEGNLYGRSLFEMFTPIIVRHINGDFKQLPAGKKK